MCIRDRICKLSNVLPKCATFSSLLRGYLKSVRTHKILDLTWKFLDSRPSNQVDLKLLDLSKCNKHSVHICKLSVVLPKFATFSSLLRGHWKSVRTHKILDLTWKFLDSGPSTGNQVDLKLLDLSKFSRHSVKHLQIVGRFTEICNFFITAERTFEIRKNSQDSGSYLKVPRLWTK